MIFAPVSYTGKHLPNSVYFEPTCPLLYNKKHSTGGGVLLRSNNRLFAFKKGVVFLNFVANFIARTFRRAHVRQFKQNTRVAIVEVVGHLADQLGILLGNFGKFYTDCVNVLTLFDPREFGLYFNFIGAGQLQTDGKAVCERGAQKTNHTHTRSGQVGQNSH